MFRKMKRMKEYCMCGKELPTVKHNETPFEFCSIECKTHGQMKELSERLYRLEKFFDGVEKALREFRD